MTDEKLNKLTRKAWEGLLAQPGIEFEGVVPTTRYLPELRAMLDLSNAELTEFLGYYGIVPSIKDMTRQATITLERLAKMSPGSPGLDAVKIETAVRKDLLGMARDAKRGNEMAIAIDGNPNQILLRICEDDENSCDVCASKSGLELTYAEHEAIGTHDCLGGALCRCEFIAVD